MLRTIERTLSSTLAFARKRLWNLLEQSEAPRSSRRSGFRPRLEVLEDRIVPTTYLDYWYGTTSTDWSTASNWKTDGGVQKVPDVNATVVFGGFGITPKP